MSDPATWQLTTLNCNGLRSAVRKGFGKWRARCGADVIALQELRMQANQMTTDHTAPRGWRSIQSDAEKKGYSGVSVWSRLAVEGAGSTQCGIPLADTEGRFARLDTEEASVVSLYVPSGSSGEARQVTKDAFLEALLEVTAGFLAEGRPMAICGDINIAHTPQDIHNPTGNKKNSGFLPHERAWLDRLLAQGWVDVFRSCNPEAQEYSWWSNRGQARAKDRGWRLDYILATPDLAGRATRAWITGRTPALSDHCPVNATFRRR